jgi:aryl-alcohol dehydrogenase-like predicted oxidoreductase
LQANLALAAIVKDLAARKGCTPAQFALAWVLAQGEDMIPIPGTKRLGYLEDNMGAPGVRLTEQDLKETNSRFQEVAVAGERYSPDMMALLQQ